MVLLWNMGEYVTLFVYKSLKSSLTIPDNIDLPRHIRQFFIKKKQKTGNNQ